MTTQTDSRTTLQAVAKEAGVSVSTVSRVIRGEKYIDAATRETVWYALERLNYRPSRIARSLKRGQDKTGIICLLVNDPKRRVSEPFFVEFLAGAVDAAADARYEVLISTAFANEAPGEVLDRTLRSQLSDGVIYLGREADKQVLSAFEQHRIPLVNLDKPIGDKTCVYVGPDNETGARKLTTHLLEHGHRRIAFIGGPDNSTASHERQIGFLATMRAHGLNVGLELVRYGLFTEESGYTEMRHLLWLDSRPTAIFAASDTMAVGAIAAASEAGLCIPEDLAIVGFDDVFLATLSQPPLTTIRQPIRRLGSTAVQKLLALINGESAVTSEVLPVEFVVRRSCGCSVG